MCVDPAQDADHRRHDNAEKNRLDRRPRSDQAGPGAGLAPQRGPFGLQREESRPEVRELVLGARPCRAGPPGHLRREAGDRPRRPAQLGLQLGQPGVLRRALQVVAGAGEPPVLDLEDPADAARLARRIDALRAEGLRTKEIAAALAEETGLSRREIYARVDTPAGAED